MFGMTESIAPQGRLDGAEEDEEESRTSYFGNEETGILPELDKFDYIIADNKFVTLTAFREGMINDEDLRQCYPRA
jgi:hypothetical protein